MKQARDTSNLFDQYLRDINRIPLLTVAEEQELGRRSRDGDKRASHRLVEANLRFVVKVAFEYRSYGVRVSDLVQEGNIGLMKAVEKFDPDKRIRLISYAVWWIRAYIQNHVLKTWSMVKIGTTQAQRKLFFSIARTRAALERLAPGSDLHETVDDEALAKRLKVRVSDVVEMTQRMAARDSSLDATIEADGTTTYLENTAAPGDGQDHLLAQAEENALLEDGVDAALAALDPRERHIVEERFMADDTPTLRELAKHFGFSRERARQIEMRALGKLKAHLEPLRLQIGWPTQERQLDGEE